MSNSRRLHRRVTLQHELDHIHGFAPIPCWCGFDQVVRVIDCSEDLLDPSIEWGWRRVAAASGLLAGPKSVPNKQETPGVDAPEVSTDRSPQRQAHSGCSPDSAR